MFDRSVIETDQFLNISMSAKALYFLLGMEADDEGFISPNRVLRLYGGEYGDIKNLIDVGLVIPFKSGVVVITNWNDNNYLDKNRIKPTKYQEEKKMLGLTENRLYVLNSGLTDVQPVERRVVESRGEESSGEQSNRRSLYGFSSFWESYPRKEGKKNAERAWSKIEPELHDGIISALKRHCESEQWIKDSGKFIPHPATWLNQERWNDEIKKSNNNEPIRI